MKPLLMPIAFAFLFGFVSNAQSADKPAKWISDKGFWVIESNKRTPKNATVYFYTNKKELIYKEAITGKRININRSTTCRRLKAVLEQSLMAWEQEKTVKENQQWLAAKL